MQEYIEQNALDAFLVLTKINRQYLSGFTGSAGILLVTKKTAALYVDDRYLLRAKKESHLRVLSLKDLSLKSFSIIKNYSKSRIPTNYNVGIEDRLTLREYQTLKKTLKGAKFVVTNDTVENLRAVKTILEIKYIQKAQRILDQMFRDTTQFSLVGMTENGVARELERLAIKFGADGMAFESIVAFGANAAAPHHLSGKQKIKRGNFLLLDFGVLVNGYHSDFTRTLFLGKPTKKQIFIYETVLNAQLSAIQHVRAGNRATTIDEVARKVITKAGFGEFFTHNTGHGVGLEIHELPTFSPKSNDKLKEGMIVTVEPGIYLANQGGVRIEDMIQVLKNSSRQISKSPKDLKHMIIN